MVYQQFVRREHMVVDGNIVAHIGAGFNEEDRGEHYVFILDGE